MNGEISMARLPYQILAILFLRQNKEIKYCTFERNNSKIQIQFIAGGGENEETPIEAAKREVFEEAGITNFKIIQLTSVCYIPTNIFSEEQRRLWDDNTFVIPEYSFAVEVKSSIIKMSDEHIRFKWVTYDEAIKTLEWDSNKTALYELHSKLNKNFI